MSEDLLLRHGRKNKMGMDAVGSACLVERRIHIQTPQICSTYLISTVEQIEIISKSTPGGCAIGRWRQQL